MARILVEAVSDERAEVSCHAIRTLRSIGRDAKYAVPALAKALEDPGARNEAAELLGRLGTDAKDAVPALIQTLTSMEEEGETEEWEAEFRRLVAEVLGQIGRDAREAVPALIGLLSDQDIEVRWEAAVALGAIGPDAVDAVPRLTHMLDNSFVPRRESEEPALLRMEGDPDRPNESVHRGARNCRYGAASALGGIGPAAKAGASSLIRALKDDEFDVREEVVWTLSELGPVAADVIPALIGALHDPDINVYEAAEHALAKVGIEAPAETVPLLLELVLGEGDSRVAYSAFAALGQIGLPAVPGLVHALKNPNCEARRLAATQLGYIGSPGSEAVSALTKASDDEDAGVRKSAADALKEINATEAATR
jgi:HEAT repeat protein